MAEGKDTALEKNAWEDLLRTLPEEERVAVSKFESLGDFLEWSYAHPDLVTDPFGTWDSRTDLVVPKPVAAEIKNQPAPSRFSRIFRRRGAQKPIQQTGTPTAWTPFPPNVSGGGQAPATPPNTSGFRNRLMSFGPRSIARRARGRITGSRLGKRIAGSRLGRLAGKANRLGGMASKATRRIKNLLNPISYLQRLFKRAFIGAVSSAIGGFATTAFAGITGLITGIGTFISTSIAFLAIKIPLIIAKISVVISAITGFIGSLPISLPVAIVLALVIFIFVALFEILFGDPSARGGTPPTSPYPGITFSKACPERVLKGGNATCQITLFHDSQSATCPLDSLTLVDDLPNGTTLVEGPGLTTGNYVYNPDIGGSVSWKLSKNITQPVVEVVQIFAFTITLTSQEDITVTNKITLAGCDIP